MTKPLRIVMAACVDAGIPNASMTHLDGIARGFVAEGHAVTLMVPRPPANRVLALDGQAGGYAIETYGHGAGLGLPRVLGFAWITPRLLARAIRRDVDLVYIRSAPLSAVPAMACHLLGRGVPVVTEHNGWIAEELAATGRPGWMRRIAGALQTADANASTKARVVTPGIGRKLTERGVPPGRILVAGNGTDLDRFYPVAREEALAALDLPSDRFHLGFIGSLAPWHGLEIAVRALPAILAQRPQTTLLIAGDGAERAGLARLADSLGVTEAVRFLGHVPVDRANIVINCFDIALAPFTTPRNSSIGLSPLKIRDYAACGRAMVSTAIEGIADGPEADWLSQCAPDDVDAFTTAVLELMANPAERARLGEAARRHAEARFGWRPIARAILGSLAGHRAKPDAL